MVYRTVRTTLCTIQLSVTYYNAFYNNNNFSLQNVNQAAAVACISKCHNMMNLLLLLVSLLKGNYSIYRK